LTIRRAVPDEYAAVGDLCVAAYGDLLDGTGDYVDALRDAAGRAADAELLVAVSPAAQGRGIATALLQHLIDETARRGRAGIVCSSQPAMRAAHRIYAMLGFTRDPERDWSPLPGVDLLAFARRLSP
jgi:GNAT superfamily N-acetyltransferase